MKEHKWVRLGSGSAKKMAYRCEVGHVTDYYIGWDVEDSKCPVCAGFCTTISGSLKKLNKKGGC